MRWILFRKMATLPCKLALVRHALMTRARLLLLNLCRKLDIVILTVLLDIIMRLVRAACLLSLDIILVLSVRFRGLLLSRVILSRVMILCLRYLIIFRNLLSLTMRIRIRLTGLCCLIGVVLIFGRCLLSRVMKVRYVCLVHVILRLLTRSARMGRLVYGWLLTRPSRILCGSSVKRRCLVRSMVLLRRFIC